ncbi:MAG: hypothetical protein LBR26_16790 [Prevotella sp.]|jgi:hypothetical protein|nr:hypothetical protein [Prevotella sp.]
MTEEKKETTAPKAEDSKDKAEDTKSLDIKSLIALIEKSKEADNNTPKSAGDIYAQQKANEIKEQEEYRKNKETIEFNIKIKDFIKDNLNYLTAGVDKIVEIADNMKYDSDSSKKQEMQKTILEATFKSQENINILPSQKQEKIKEYFQLSDDSKRKLSADYWELVEDVINIKKIVNRQRDLQQSRNGLATDNDPMDKKMFELSKNVYRKPFTN